MALHIINYSIDTRGAFRSFVAENTSHKEAESIVEFVLESIVGIENAITEHNEQEDECTIDFEKEEMFVSNLFSFEYPKEFQLTFCDFFGSIHQSINRLQFYLETVTPPPWATF